MTDDRPQLPEAEELHRMARSSALPTAFASTREQLETAIDHVAKHRGDMHYLIRAAHRQGVGPAVLARWSGYAPARIYQILDGQ